MLKRIEVDQVGVAVVAELTGLTRRMVRWLATEAVLVPENDGIGVGNRHRFSAAEVGIACVIARLYSARLTIGVLRLIAQHLRPYFIGAGRVGSPVAAVAISSARSGVGRNFLLIRFGAEDLTISFFHSATDDLSPMLATIEAGPGTFTGVVDLNAALRGLR